MLNKSGKSRHPCLVPDLRELSMILTVGSVLRHVPSIPTLLRVFTINECEFSQMLFLPLVQPLWRTVWRFLKKLEIELPNDLAIPLLGIHTEETRIERDTCIPMFIAALFTIARTWK